MSVTGGMVMVRVSLVCYDSSCHSSFRPLPWLLGKDLFQEIDLEAIAIERLKTFEPEKGYYFANSGGKDSGVCRHLLIKSGVKFDAHYNWTTVDPPELLRHIKKN